MKFCPKCGNKLLPTDKFCKRCGKKLISNKPVSRKTSTNNSKFKKPMMSSQHASTQPRMPKTAPKMGMQSEPADKKQSIKDKLAKNRKLRNNCLLIAACVLLIAAGAMVFFTLQSNSKQKADEAAYAQNMKHLGFEKADRLSPKDTAGLAISYAHKHFGNDSDWNDVYEDAEDGHLHVKETSEYQFENYKVTAPKQGAIYVINNKMGYVVSDVHHPSTAKVTYISPSGKSDQVFFPSLTKTVNDNYDRNEVQHVVSKINMNGNDDDDDTSDSNDDSSDTSNDDSDEDVSWDDDKEEQLADFMDSFGEKMKQDYEEYDGENSLDCHADTYPDDFDSDIKLVTDDDETRDDGESIDIDWDPDLEKDCDYHCVAIFNCNQQGGESHITYLFCIYDDKPVVLVDQSTNGGITVQETKNKDVKNAFANILAGKDVDSDDDDDSDE